MEKTILVVSDHLELQEGFRQCLKNGGIKARLVQAYNAGQVVNRVEDHHPDLIIMSDLIPAGFFPYIPSETTLYLRDVCLALLGFLVRREMERGLPRSSKALITCHGKALARELDAKGLSHVCDHIFEVPFLGFLETVQTLLDSKVDSAIGPAQPIQRCVTLPLAPVAVLPFNVGPFRNRKKRTGQARKRQQSCIIELLEVNCRKRG